MHLDLDVLKEPSSKNQKRDRKELRRGSCYYTRRLNKRRHPVYITLATKPKWDGKFPTPTVAFCHSESRVNPCDASVLFHRRYHTMVELCVLIYKSDKVETV